MTTYLGRSFEDVLFEFHTMLVLKDYKDTDERWRLEWLGDYNDGLVDNTGAPTRLFPIGAPIAVGIRSQKPFVKSAASGGSGYPVTPDSPWPDQLRRVHRVQDTYTCLDPKNCTGPNLVVNTLAKDQTLESAVPVSMGKWGSAYVSIHPALDYGPLDIWIEVQSGKPRFRVYHIDTNGNPVLLPGCKVGSPSEACPLSLTVFGTSAVKLQVTPGVFASWATDEILIVASSGGEQGSFKWRFGEGQAHLEIVGPTAGSPAHIGNIDFAGKLTRHPFVLYFTATDGAGNQVATVSSNNLVISAGGKPINKPGDCPSPVGGATCPFKLLGLSGGKYMAVVDVPPAFYPAGTGKLDLRIDVDPPGTIDGDAEPGALAITAGPRFPLTEFVIDVSGSMKEDGKLAAAKAAASFIVDGMSDDELAGLTIFSTQSLQVRPAEQLSLVRATLKSDIATILGHGSTSIGNALLRAQDDLANVDGTPLVNNFLPGIIVLTDGENNCAWSPNDYVYFNPTGDRAPLPGTGECTIGTVPTYFPWPSPPKTTYDHPFLGWFKRVKEGLPLPIINSIGVGPRVDMGELDLVADLSGGIRFWIPSLAPPQLMSLTANFADGFRHAANEIAGYQRSDSAHVPNVEALPSFQVDADTTEVLVSLLTVDAELAPLSTQLVGPNGASIDPERVTDSTKIFRLQDPLPGTYAWQIENPSPEPDGANRMFLEVAVRSACQLLTRTDVDGGVPAAPGNSGFDDMRWAGRELLLQALVHDGSSVRSDAMVQAQVRYPNGWTRPVTLFDDGRHFDGGAEDGVFAARVIDTAQPGTYSVKYSGYFSSDVDLPARCTRQRADAVTLRAALDADENGIADWWENHFALADGAGTLDPDQDGLTNVDEFLAHTSPVASDTDGGGESDASEIAAGRDPNDDQDDATGKPALVIAPGNGKVLLQTGVPLVDGATLVIRSSASRTGTFVPLDLSVSEIDGLVRIPAPNDLETCYTARVRTADAVSGWTSVVCATPRPDPVPPTIETIRLTETGLCARRPTARIEIHASDGVIDSAIGSELGELSDPSVEISGLTEMRVFTATNPSNVWQPFSPLVSVSLGTAATESVVVELRDGAGNETGTRTFDVRRCDATGLDRAILLEERALVKLDQGDLTGARSLIQQSLTQIGRSIDIVKERVSTPHTAEHVLDTQLLAGLSVVRATKLVATKLGGPKAVKTTWTVLHAALESEYELAELAYANRKEL